MSSGASVSEEEGVTVRDEQRMVYVLALANLPFWGLDLLASPGWVPWDTLGLRVAWSGAMALAAMALARVRPTRRWLLRMAAGALLPNLFMGFIVHQLGGSGNPEFAWFCALPLVTLVVCQGDVRVALASAGATLLVGMVLLVRDGHSLASVATWMLLFLASGVVAVLSVRFYGQLQRAQAEAEARRRGLQETLASTQVKALESERLAQVGRLAAGVAHEVNNPLAFIQSNLRFLQEELPRSDGDRQECVQALRETQAGVERIRQIVQDLTAYARSTAAVREVGVCPLSAVIEESVRLASVRLKRLAVEVEMPREMPAVRADPRQLGQVLLNLLLNSADALEEARVVEPRVVLRVLPEQARVRLVLEDNGPGIAPEHLPQLFTPFFTTKEEGKGTGLGLALSRQYVEGFGGTLRAENRPEGGARFTVELLAA